MNKPLSRVRRAEIERDLADQHVSYNDFAGEAIRDLLASESFWRESVKKVEPWGDVGAASNTWYECFFCKAEGDEIFAFGRKANETHKPDCAWLLAQES